MAAHDHLPLSGFWTWDHSTNWGSDMTRVESGCRNRYPKMAESFGEDYRHLMEFMAEKDLRYLIIWGLFRETHGGERAVHELLAIARGCGVKVLPGVGVNAYGGFVFEGEHPWSLETWLREHPELAAVRKNPMFRAHPSACCTSIACPSKEETIRWYEEGIRWLFRTFDVAGVNLETGDYGVCECATCRSRAQDRSREQRFSHQDIALALPPVIEAALDVRPDAVVTYATYSGFTTDMTGNPPPFVETIPPEAICQWTLTDMPYPEPWSTDPSFHPPTARNTGYTHWGSQWASVHTRHALVINHVKEMCSRSSAAGLEGVFMHGEVSAHEQFTARMNYEALSYFRKHPDATLEGFAHDRLADAFGGPDPAAEALRWMTEPVRDPELSARRQACRKRRIAAERKDQTTAGNWRNVEHLLLARSL